MSARRRGSDVLYGVLVAGALGLVAWLSVRHPVDFDLSHGARGSLAAESREALAALEGPVEVVSWARPQGELRGRVAAFVERYRRLREDVVLRFADPTADPAGARAAGIRVEGELRVRAGEREQPVLELSERAFTGALLKLARAEARVFAFSTGHGERRCDGEANHDWGEFGAAMAAQSLRCVHVALDAEPLPENVDALVVAAPRLALGERARAQLAAFVDGGGALWLLLEPDTPEAVLAVLAPLGLRRLPGVVVDAAGQALGVGDPSLVALPTHPDHPALAGFDLTVLLPQPAALASLGAHAFAPRALLRSGARSWNETGAIAEAIRQDDADGELPGPHDVALALTRLSPRPGATEQRVLVTGDADFLGNAWLGNGGNRALGLRLAAWLVDDDPLLALAPPQAPDRAFALGERAMAWLGLGLLVGVPLAVLGLGAWRLRRRRARGVD